MSNSKSSKQYQINKTNKLQHQNRKYLEEQNQQHYHIQQQQYHAKSSQSSSLQKIQAQKQTQNKAQSQTQNQAQCQKFKNFKMIQFIDYLYSKFKLLNKLSDQQSNHFQTQVIQMLIDQNQNLDAELYKQTVSKIGLSTFVLEVLSVVVKKRNQFKNQYQMNKNIQQITKQLENQQKDIINRTKQLIKKQNAHRKRQQEIFENIQKKVKQLQKKSLQTILAVQTQIKKKISTLTTNLKSKQKEVGDKINQMKQNIKKIKEFSNQQKVIQQKTKLFQKKQKEIKLKEKQLQRIKAQSIQSLTNMQLNSNKKSNQMKGKINQLEQSNNKLNQQIKKLNKKLKTNQMAYRHLKQDTQKKLLSKEAMQKQQNTQAIQQNKSLKAQTKKLNDEKLQLQEKLNNNINNNQELKKKNSQIKRSNQQIKRKSEQVRKSSENIITKKQNIIKKHQQVIKQLSKQNQTLKKLLSQKGNTLSYNYEMKHFDELDISKIQDLSIQQRQYLPMTQRDDDKSILHHLAQSIIIEHNINPYNQYRKTDSLKDKQIDQISNQIDFSQQLFQSRNRDIKKQQEQECSSEPSQQWMQENDKQNKKQNIAFFDNYFKQTDMQTEKQKLNKIQMNINTNLNSNNKKVSLTKQKTPSHDNSSSKKMIKPAQSKLMVQHQQPSKCGQHVKQIQKQTKVIPKVNNKKQKPSKDPQQYILQKLQKILEQTKCSHNSPLTKPQNSLNTLIDTISKQHKYSKTLVEAMLQIFLKLMQSCQCDSNSNTNLIMKNNYVLLFKSVVIDFLQQIFLKHFAISETIQQQSIIILARILLSGSNQKQQYLNGKSKQGKFVTLSEKYLKMIRIKMLGQKDQFIIRNINFLLQYQNE